MKKKNGLSVTFDGGDGILNPQLFIDKINLKLEFNLRALSRLNIFLQNGKPLREKAMVHVSLTEGYILYSTKDEDNTTANVNSISLKDAQELVENDPDYYLAHVRSNSTYLSSDHYYVEYISRYDKYDSADNYWFCYKGAWTSNDPINNDIITIEIPNIKPIKCFTFCPNHGGARPDNSFNGTGLIISLALDLKVYYDDLLKYESSIDGLDKTSRIIVNMRTKSYTIDNQAYILQPSDRLAIDNVIPE